MKSRVVLAGVFLVVALAVPAAGAPDLSPKAEPATPALGQWRCWAPAGTVPCGYVLSVSGVSPTDAWAVGPAGTIMHWDDSSWQTISSPTDNELTAIAMVSASDGWAVGWGGVILRWDGSAWRQVASPSTEGLLDVDLVSATDGWAVGSGGAILHWNGNTWNLVPGPSQQTLVSISMVSATDGWAVGGAMIHWDGVRWIEASASSRWLSSVVMLSPTDGWAAGSGGTILHWDGSDWLAVPSPTTDDFYGLSMAATDAGWIVGGSVHPYNPHCSNGWMSHVLLRWDGVAWTEAASPVDTVLRHVAMVSPDEGWAAGDKGTILYWNGNGWNATTPPPSTTPWEINDVTMVSATDGWVVGSISDRCLIARWDGQTWTRVPADCPSHRSLNAVALASLDDGWAVGDDGIILHWDGQAWTAVDSPTSYPLNAVAMASPDDGWAVGSGIFHWDGYAWSQVASPTYAIPQSVSVVSATDAWAVAGSKVLHWDGASWSTVSTDNSMPLYSVSMVSATDGWAMGGEVWSHEGAFRIILHWDGADWNRVGSGYGVPLYAVDMVSATDGWATGGAEYVDPYYGCSINSYAVEHWDGLAWQSGYPPVNIILKSVDMLSPIDGWAAGGDTLLHYTGTWSDYHSYLPVILNMP